MKNTRTYKIGLWRFVVIVRRNKTGRNSLLGRMLDWAVSPFGKKDIAAAAVWFAFMFASVYNYLA